MTQKNNTNADSPKQNRPASRSRKSNYALQVNSYDRSSSVLVALLIMVGATVVGLVIIYFTSRAITVQTAIPVMPVNAASASQGLEDDSLPEAENVPEQLELELQETLNVMDGLIAAQIAMFDTSEGDPNATPGRGDPRATGVGGGVGPPEPQREIRFEPESLNDYAAWFDETGFELGVLGRDNKVYYASGLSGPKPKLREGTSSEEKRLYFINTSGPLAPLDKQLARKAGLLAHGSIIIKFCSAQTQQKLLTLEAQATNGKTTDQIERTIFRVERNRGKYDFQVEKITMRR